MYKKTTLSNGIRLITVQNKNVETTTALALFGVGSRDEQGKIEGIAHFLEHMIFKGTEKRPHATDISKELDNVGASYNAFTGKEYTGFWAQTGRKDLPLALDIISDIILHSKFDEAEIKNEKGAVIEEINMYEDAPMRNIPSVFEDMLYRGQSLGHDQLGNKENVKNFSRKDLMDFYRKHYTADNLIIAISGNFNDGKIDSWIEKLFLLLPRQGKKVKRIKNIDNQTKTDIFLKYKETDQTNLSLGFRALPAGHKDEYALYILETILGGNSSSRLYDRIRERAGLVYYIYAYAENYQDVGYITIQAGVGNDKCQKAIGMIMEEIRRVCNERISMEEIERAKSYTKGRMAIALESSSAMANFVASQEISTGKILTPDEKFDKINAVTAEDLRRVARKIFTQDKLNLALIGPFKDKKEFQKLLKI